MTPTLRTVTNDRLVDWEKLDNLPSDVNSELALKEDKANKWQINWYAELGADWKVPASQLPASTVWWDIGDLDDVTITSVANWEALIYNSTSWDWENTPLTWGWDMLKATYDTNASGVVDNSETLEGMTLREARMENKTGFDRRSPITMWIIELSPDWTTIYSISSDGTYTTNTSWNFANGTVYETPAIAREMAIYPETWETSFSVFVENEEFVKTALERIELTNTTWLRVVAYNSAWALFETFTPQDYNTFTWSAFISAIYWNMTTQELVLFADERHWIEMDAASHYYEHFSEWTRYISWLWINGLASWSSVYTSVWSWVLFDEDLIIDITSKTNTPFWYLEGTGWRIVNDGLDIWYITWTNPNYNLNTGWVWSLAEVGNNDYILTHFFATNDKINPVVKILGQWTYPTISTARAWALVELNNLVLDWMPTPEFKPLATVIVNDDGELVLTDTWDTFIDWRETKITGTSWTSWVTNLHSDLTDTDTDWHPADIISYDNATSWLTATNVKAAIDEVDWDLDTLTNIVSWISWDYVDLTTTQTIWWVKTFSSSPIIPAPTTDLQAATKKYVDDNAWGWGGWGLLIDFASNNTERLRTLWEYVMTSTVSWSALRISLITAPVWADFIVTLYKNWVSEWTVTIATTDTATNGLYQKELSTFTSWSYVAWDVLKIEITQVWTTVKWSWLTVRYTT